MAKNRLVDTVFWEDNYSSDLDPIEKLLFLYFLTNSSTSICGVYQITLKKTAVETGIEKEMVEKILLRFSNDNKIYFIDGWIILVNFIKHQNQGSPRILKGIDTQLSNLPDKIRTFCLSHLKGIDTLSHSNSNSNSNSNSKSKNKKELIFFLSFFKKTFRDKFKTDPALDEDEALELIDNKFTLFANQSEAEDFITAYFNSDKGEEYGYTLTACFTDHTINLFKTGKLNQTSIDCDA